MEEVLSYAGSLSLPVQPDSAGTVMNVISAIDTVDCGVHFNSADFRTGKVLLVVDVMNMIIFNQRENSAEVSDNTSLAAVVNVTAADNV